MTTPTSTSLSAVEGVLMVSRVLLCRVGPPGRGRPCRSRASRRVRGCGLSIPIDSIRQWHLGSFRPCVVLDWWFFLLHRGQIVLPDLVLFIILDPAIPRVLLGAGRLDLDLDLVVAVVVILFRTRSHAPLGHDVDHEPTDLVFLVIIRPIDP